MYVCNVISNEAETKLINIMKNLTLNSISFDNCFGTRTITLLNSLVFDNKEYIKDFGGNICDYLLTELSENESFLYTYMNDDALFLYESLVDSADKAMISDLLSEYILNNFNYELN